MLKLLLDEHISPKVAIGLRLRQASLIVQSMAEWKGGAFMGREDSACLEEAAAYGSIFVTYDRRTIPPLLKVWAEEGRHHAGIIYVDQKTIPSSDFGAIIRALNRLVEEGAEWQWTDLTVFLRR